MVVKVLVMELYDILFSMIPNMKVFWDLGYIPLLFKYYLNITVIQKKDDSYWGVVRMWVQKKI